GGGEGAGDRPTLRDPRGQDRRSARKGGGGGGGSEMSPRRLPARPDRGGCRCSAGASPSRKGASAGLDPVSWGAGPLRRPGPVTSVFGILRAHGRQRVLGVGVARSRLTRTPLAESRGATGRSQPRRVQQWRSGS